ncbi:MAG: hypothetical protein U9R21_03590, partial [Candidatus Thermoplasmatota archaeon]|nr:hypothetical protein [Candidatus Thermoplasmatota archaeon]
MKLLQKNRSRLILCFLVWWMCIAVFYMITVSKISRVRKTISQSGVEMAKVFSSRVSLPLLELDMPTLSALLNKATSKSDIVYAAIVDHKNNIMAYTNVELIMSIKKEGALTVDQVTFWKGDSSAYKRIVSFSSDVIYAETKIGEIYLAISAAEIDKFEKRFSFGALSSFTILLFVIIVLYYKEVRSIVSKLRAGYRSQAGSRGVFAETTRIACPLCGTNKTFSKKVFNYINLDRFRIIRSTNSELKLGGSDKSKDIFLSEIAKRKDLGWLKRQVIVRCIEIIKKL